MHEKSVILLSSLSQITDQYDGFIIDLWGVIHDGQTPFPASVDCLKQLKDQGKKIVLLSNAPRRSHVVVDRLREMGVADYLYDHIMTSGEAAHQALRQREDPWYQKLGHRCYLIGSLHRDSSIFEETDITLATNVTLVPDFKQADFILNTGVADFGETLDDYKTQLDDALAHKIPMICANPDRVVMVKDQRVVCAGTLADYYESLGGDVMYHGKPYSAIYQTCFDLLGLQDKKKILALGDALETDIKGGQSVGIDTLWVTSLGIYASTLGLSPNLRSIGAICDEHKLHPTYAIPRFCF